MLPHHKAQAAADAHHLIEAVEDVYRPATAVPTAYRDASPLPAVGTAPPVPQPGRPPMSQQATDISGVMLAAGIASVPVAGSVSLVMWTIGQIDPLVVGIVSGAPVALLAVLSRVLKGVQQAREAAPPTHHHHYTGTVVQDRTTVTSHTRGLIARTNHGSIK